MKAVVKPNIKATLKQVADQAGVSLATASMILSRKEGVSFSAETISRVQMAAEALSYGRQASSNRGIFKKRVIAVFLPNVSGSYYTAMVHAVNLAASQKGYDVVCFEAYRDKARELRGLSSVSVSDMAGIIFTYIPHNYELVEQMAISIPTVVIGNRNNVLNMDMVETDSYRAGALLARHMIKLGHREIAFIATVPEWWGYSSHQRIKGVKDTFQNECPHARLTVVTRKIGSSLPYDGRNDRRIIGRELAEECLKDQRVTGFIAVSDYLAYGVLDALAERGYQAPKDYSVCGCDDLFASSLPGVSLTSVDHHNNQKGKRAFDLLYSKITAAPKEQEPVSIMRVEYLSTLVVRNSTGKPRSKAILAADEERKAEFYDV